MNKDLKELAENVKSSFELFDCKFVAPFPKEVQTDCSVCLHTLKQPYIVGCCGYRFCKSCLSPSVISCPLWKEVNFDKLQDKQLERLLIQRPVYCLLQDSGCKWTGALGKLSSHLSFEDSLSVTACEKLPVPCSHCGSYFKRADPRCVRIKTFSVHLLFLQVSLQRVSKSPQKLPNDSPKVQEQL